MKLDGKVALITGAAGGIGKAYVEALLNHGAKISILDILQEEGEATTEKFNHKYGAGLVLFILCDVTNADNLEDAFKQTKKTFGRLDIVINNAGVFYSHFKRVVDVNYTAVIHGTYLAVENMSKEKGGEGGLIVNVSSISGLEPLAMESLAVYTGTKHAIRAFTQSYAASIDNEKCGIRINTICPPAMESAGKSKPVDANLEALIEKYGGRIKIEEMGKALIHLAEDDSLHNVVMVVTKGKHTFWSHDQSAK